MSDTATIRGFHEGVPERLDQLAEKDPIIYAFLSSLRASHRRWDSEVAIELVAYMAQRNEEQTKHLTRLLTNAPQPPILLQPR